MRISMVGTGYVGLVTGTCFAQMGNTVSCIDVAEKKIENLKKGLIPLYEPGLESLVKDNLDKSNLLFTTSLSQGLKAVDFCFIAVGTPMQNDGHADLRFVLDVAKQIGQLMTTQLVIVNKSTVPVGTADEVQTIIQNELDKRGVSLPFAVVSNPEFLKEGEAVNDFMKPDRVIVGTNNDWALEMMRELYKPFTFNHDRLIAMDVRSAEMTKYAANAMLATKISFMNEMANICEKIGADVNQVRLGIGADARIGYSFIYPGCGYGGSCFPKDVKALEKTALDNGYTPRLLQAIEAINHDQKKLLASKVLKRFGENLQGKVFAVWGLAFKPDTNDMREASSLTLIQELTAKGAMVRAYDPQAINEAKNSDLKNNPRVIYCDDKYQAVQGSDALILVTEWKEFRSPDFSLIAQSLTSKVIFDGRNQYSLDFITQLGFEYYPIGVGKR